MMKVFIFVFLIIQLTESQITCDSPMANLTLTSTNQNETLHKRSKRYPQNLRITQHYDSSYYYMSNYNSISKMIIDPAVQYWQDALVVRNPLTSPLLIDRECVSESTNKNNVKVCSTACKDIQMCYTTTIPPMYIQQCYVTSGGTYVASGNPGYGAVSTDLLVIITYNAIGCSGSMLAYAVSCELEHQLDRPVLGLINICPGKIDLANGVQEAILTLKHELAHILGMSANLFAFYRDGLGFPLTPRDSNGYPAMGFKTVGTTRIYQYSQTTIYDTIKVFYYPTGNVGKGVSYLITPSVLREVRDHFNCPSLEGIMLEDYGNSETALSHFEKLYLQNEVMTSTISIKSKLSRLILAVLNDTGWYIPNYDKADYFDFSKNVGCDFVTRSCYEYMRIRSPLGMSIQPYCNTTRSTFSTCTYDNRDVQYCDLYDNRLGNYRVPDQFKYFPDPNLVSSDPNSDFCPFLLSTNCVPTYSKNDPQTPTKAVRILHRVDYITVIFLSLLCTLSCC